MCALARVTEVLGEGMGAKDDGSTWEAHLAGVWVSAERADPALVKGDSGTRSDSDRSIVVEHSEKVSMEERSPRVLEANVGRRGLTEIGD
ncbi:hypothetical protein MPNT_560006 [Candidatus Methylacidithermus pantelleriae]|uniref:Uncharacterized protein n=1 Tax=Candidatus Methylacidithermus pantelleriae TaxID=2744239 RepID=A0A8J2BMV2_9BACT|nr:hypothetical protein MPNT_560006 [Candidatus Methylacidithermus pantelleriae]